MTGKTSSVSVGQARERAVARIESLMLPACEMLASEDSVDVVHEIEVEKAVYVLTWSGRRDLKPEDRSCIDIKAGARKMIHAGESRDLTPESLIVIAKFAREKTTEISENIRTMQAQREEARRLAAEQTRRTIDSFDAILGCEHTDCAEHPDLAEACMKKTLEGLKGK